MIIYFTDRNLNIQGTASTDLPGGPRILEDLTVEEISSGVNIFTCLVSCDRATRQELKQAAQVGHFVLKSGGNAFESAENSYDSLYQITESDLQGQILNIYCEDAGLELVNKVVGEETLTDKTLLQMLQSFVPDDWSINLISAPTETKTYTWEGENTATERINSIAQLFGCEVYYSFGIERMEITEKIINVIPKRGALTPVKELRVGRDISNISIKTSIKELATAFAVTGGTPEGSNVPIDLKNYDYSYTDPETGDVYEVDKPTGQMRNITAMKRWSSVLNKDGLIVKRFSFDDTNKAVVAGQSRAELQKASKEQVEYEAEIIHLPEGIQVGDRVHIIDEEGELFLDARFLKKETSESVQTEMGDFGEYVKKESGINPEIKAFAKQFAESVKKGLDGVTISISSSGGNVFHNTAIETTLQATVFIGSRAITTQEELEAVFGTEAKLNWYSEIELIGTGFELEVSSTETQLNYKVRLLV